MDAYCFHCGSKLEIAAPGQMSLRDTCPKCHSDIHVCRNCKHYSRQAYNECREPQAERVVDKEKGNYCEYFNLADGPSSSDTRQKDYLKQLDKLFK